MTAAELDPALRKLIDARLESIDRILAGAGISWSERRSIVDEVETQIFELLARRSPTPAQEDVLSVLATLDPPESYLPEELRDHAPTPGDAQAAVDWGRLPRQATGLVLKLIPIAAGVIALVIVNSVIIAILIGSEGVIPWLITVACLGWLNVVGVRRFRAWSATRRGDFISDLRHSLAAWLMPKGGAPAT